MSSFSDFEFQELLQGKKYKEIESKIKEDLSSIIGEQAKFFTSGAGIYYYDPAYRFISGRGGGTTKFMFRGSPGKWSYSFITERNNNRTEPGDVKIKEFNDYQEAVNSLIKHVAREKVSHLVSYYVEAIRR